MKLLLDECVLAGSVPAYPAKSTKCLTVPEAGFAGKTNGELIALAEASFDVFITLDKGFAYQQNLTGRKIAILLIRAKSARLVDLVPHAQACREAIASIKLGEIIQIRKSK
jgi:predicted nuclease of predicted toxin-antitoxin system